LSLSNYRFYNDFHLLNIWDSNGVFFVVRHKENLQYTTVKELELPDNRHQNILKDEIIELENSKYPKLLRRIAAWNDEKQFVVEIITNNLTWTANSISELYKSRWQIEIFFRELKQLLHIKSFIGTSENAVMIQIWTALITILILKALKATAKYGLHLSNLVAFIRLNLFVKIDLQIWLDKPFEPPPENVQNYTQRVIFDENH
jgi:IS4 transposase